MSHFIYLVIFVLCLQLIILLENNIIDAGVVGLTKFLRRKGSGSAWRPASISQTFFTDHLCIDMNQLVHTSVRSKSTPNLHQCSRRMFFELDNILKYVSPKKSLVLVFDGPAPFAKLQTQRNRRIVSPESNIITPGTDFMALVESLMVSYAFSRVNRLRNVTVYISGTTAPGEGEVKIIDWATTHITNRNESLVVCGLDSDILVQGIILSKISEIQVLQLGKDYSAAFCNISLVIDNLAFSANLTDPELLNVTNDRFTREDINRDLYLESIANGNIPAKASSYLASLTQFQLESIVRHGLKSRKPDTYLTEYPKSFGLDLIALFVMQGNDYLPKVRGVTMDRALLAYGNVMKLLPPENRCLLDTERNSFNFVALYLLMQELRCDSVQLHVQVPRPVSSLYELAQRNVLKCDMEWMDESVDLHELPINRTQLLWRTSLTVNGVNMTSHTVHPSKASARDSLARKILERWAPDALEDMNRRRAQAQGTLREYQSSVLNEERAQFESLRELVASGGDAQLWDSLYAQFNANNSSSDSDSDAVGGSLEKDRGTCDGEGEEDNNGMVSEEGYARYARDSDVEEYLRGILWTVQMYSDGFCPDVSYTYAGRPPVSPFLIVNYISKIVWKNCLLAGLEDFDLPSTVRHLFRSLYAQPIPVSSKSQPGRDKISKAAMKEQLQQLQSLILGNRIGVGAGGVSWQELKSNVYVPTSSCRPLSADATCACLLPQSATEKVPLHLRHVWSEMHDAFFEELDDLLMRRSSYDSLTNALEKVWNLGEEPTAGSLVLGRSDTESAGKGRVTAGGSEVQLLPLGDTRSVESAVADLTSVYSRRDGLVRRSSGFRRQIVVDHLKLGASASLVNSTDKVFEDVLKDNLAQPIQSMKTREEKGNLALASSMKKDKLPTGRKLPRVSGVFAGAKDCQWTVVTSDPSLTAAGLFPLADISAPFKASLLKPMKIPRSVKVLMIPQTRLSPLRKFNFYEPDKPMTPPKKTST